MRKFLKVEIEGKYIGDDRTIYQALDEGTEYTDADLEQYAQDVVNQEFTWGHDVVDEDQVPESERE